MRGKNIHKKNSVNKNIMQIVYCFRFRLFLAHNFVHIDITNSDVLLLNKKNVHCYISFFILFCFFFGIFVHQYFILTFFFIFYFLFFLHFFFFVFIWSWNRRKRVYVFDCNHWKRSCTRLFLVVFSIQWFTYWNI